MLLLDFSESAGCSWQWHAWPNQCMSRTNFSMTLIGQWASHVSYTSRWLASVYHVSDIHLADWSVYNKPDPPLPGSVTYSAGVPRVGRIKLKDTCVVLRSSLSRTSLNTSQSSLTQSSASLSDHRSQSSSALPTNYLARSTTSLPAEITTDCGGHRALFCGEF